MTVVELAPLNHDNMNHVVQKLRKSITPDEQAFMMYDEPNAQPVNAYGISQGRQSRVDVLRFHLPQLEEETLVIWKRMGVGKRLTEPEAANFHDRLRPYRRALRASGWNIPKLFQTRLIPDGEFFVITSWEEYIQGGDGEHLVAAKEQPNYRKAYLIRAAIETLAEYGPLHQEQLAGKTLSLMPHGLDLKLANLVLTPRNRLYFIDLFGPKELDEDGTWRTYSPKLDSLSPERLRAVTASREGAILRLYRLAEQTWLESGTYDQEDLRSQVPDLLSQSGLPGAEIDFILDEIRSDYPWLTSLYSEEQV